MGVQLASCDGLLIVDVQNDFLAGGSLAIPLADRVVPVINAYITLFAEHSLSIFASRDWHPADHCSFIPQGGVWPTHCVAGTAGADFPQALKLPALTRIISKAELKEKDAYSAFDSTGLADLLTLSSVSRLFVCGLATEYCVLHTVRDARQNRIEVVLLIDAISAVDVKGGSRALDEMSAAGAVRCTLTELRR